MHAGVSSWVDTTSVPGIFDLIAFIVTAIGIGIALRQLFKSRSAIEAAQETFETTRSTLIRNQLIAVLPRFETNMGNLNRAMRDEQREIVVSELTRFGSDISEALVLLRAHSSDYEDVAKQMESARQFAGDAIHYLYGESETEIAVLIRAEVAPLRELVTLVRGMQTQIQHDPGKSHVNGRG